jgi:hypothetical protein
MEIIIEAARLLAENLKADIPLAKTREEHIRVSARANEALAIYNSVSNLENKIE